LMQSLNVSATGPLALKPVADNAVLPAWRKTAVHCIVSGTWDWDVPRTEMERRQDVLANEITPGLMAITPGSGTYLNEGNFNQPDWQQQYYGDNYQRLLEIKKTYDPESFFYATEAVGSEA
jgi:hypothetical protein